MVEKLIDLSNFKKGVTLDVQFDFTGQAKPFLIFITNEAKDLIFYYRFFDKNRLSINLPEHTEKIYLYSDKPILQILTRKLQPYQLPYKYNEAIITKRPYKFEDIRTELVDFIPDPKTGLPSNQPARFLPDSGLKQISLSVFKRLPQPTRKFINEHENGHYYYGRPLPPQVYWNKFTPEQQKEFARIYQEDEEEADRYAVYKCINEGYNFSGAFSSVADFLSDSEMSRKRIEKVLNTIKQEHKNLSFA